MKLAHAWILHFMWLLPLAGLALVVCHRQRAKALERFADPELLVRLTGEDKGRRRFFKGLFLLSALGLMLFALTGPRWGSHYQEVSQKGVDIMILVDVSPSMLVEDIKPNRLERARREIMDFLRVVRGDRVGLVALSGAAFIQCPLTLDYGALEMFLSQLEPDLIPVPGTDLGAAIEKGLSSFDFKTETDKVMLFITDGEDNEAKGLEVARKAAEKGVKVFVFGMGEPSGGPIPAGDGKGGFKKDKDGKLILSRLDEEGLSQIASITGGAYARSVSGDLDLDILYFEGIKSRTKAETLKSGKIKVYEERFPIFLLAAFLFLVLEGLLVERKAIFTFLVVLVFSAQASAGQGPDELYSQGCFAEAEKAYADLDMDHPKELRYRYNRGCAAYQNSDYQAAVAAFSSVLRRAQGDETRFKSAYNLGNAAYKQEDFATAAAHYKKAIFYSPESEDAKHNLELALRELEKQKKEKAEEPEKGPQKDPGRPQDKKDHPKSGKEEEGPEKASQDRDQGDEKGQAESGPAEESFHALPDKDEEAAGPAAATIDKKKAEALLDNVKEDRSRFLRFQISRDKKHGVPSGKDW
ncbi:MAG: VWA domain-containing protein [Proteobacteria bacterium]|nr:VWA domain-containing protein [Pseudomonadota bacterium]